MTQLTSEIAKASQTAKTDVSGARVGEDIYIFPLYGGAATMYFELTTQSTTSRKDLRK